MLPFKCSHHSVLHFLSSPNGPMQSTRTIYNLSLGSAHDEVKPSMLKPPSPLKFWLKQKRTPQYYEQEILSKDKSLQTFNSLHRYLGAIRLCTKSDKQNDDCSRVVEPNRRGPPLSHPSTHYAILNGQDGICILVYDTVEHVLLLLPR